MIVDYRRLSVFVVHAALTCSCWSGSMNNSAWAVTLSDGSFHVFTSSEPLVDVLDGGAPSRPTILTVETGGDISFLYVYNRSVANANSGEISHVSMHDLSQLVVNGTTISHVNLLDSSTGRVDNGHVDHFRAYDQSRGAIYGGSAEFVSALGRGSDGGVPATIGHAEIDVFGGSVGVLRPSVGGVVNMRGGTVADINPFPGGTSNVYGGILTRMTLNDGTVTNVFGRNFKLTFDQFIFDIPEYRLTGTLGDGSPLNALVLLPSGAELRFIPEPWSFQLALIAFAISALRRQLSRKPLI